MGARNSDPGTSHAAFASVKVNLLEQRVYDALLHGGSMTAEEVSDYLRMDKQSITPRFRPMANKGRIRLTGSERKNRSGRSAQVWAAVVAPKGKAP